MDQAEAWKMSGRKSSGFLQEINATTLTKYFRSMHPLFNLFLPALIPQRNKDKAISNIAAINSIEVKAIRNWD